MTHSLWQTDRETERVSLDSEPSCPHTRMPASSRSHDTLRCASRSWVLCACVCVPICTFPHRSVCILGWPKVCVFHTDLWKHSNSLANPIIQTLLLPNWKPCLFLFPTWKLDIAFSYGLHKGNSLSEVLGGGVKFTGGFLSAKHFSVFKCSFITPTTTDWGSLLSDVLPHYTGHCTCPLPPLSYFTFPPFPMYFDRQAKTLS